MRETARLVSDSNVAPRFSAAAFSRSHHVSAIGTSSPARLPAILLGGPWRANPASKLVQRFNYEPTTEKTRTTKAMTNTVSATAKAVKRSCFICRMKDNFSTSAARILSISSSVAVLTAPQ
jgi:hypothetical protein